MNLSTKVFRKRHNSGVGMMIWVSGFFKGTMRLLLMNCTKNAQHYYEIIECDLFLIEEEVFGEELKISAR